MTLPLFVGNVWHLPGCMWGVYGFATDKEGNLYTAEVRTGRVQKYTPRKGVNPKFLVGKPWSGVWKKKRGSLGCQA